MSEWTSVSDGEYILYSNTGNWPQSVCALTIFLCGVWLGNGSGIREQRITWRILK